MKKLVSGFLMALFFAMPAWSAVDLNAATLSELESVKGIGPAKAKSIVAHRDKNGPFKSVDDLAMVKGFGKASVDKIKDQLSVGAAKSKP